MRKVVDLQILRATAASLVVVDHAFPSLEFRGVSCGYYLKAGFLLGHLGVTAFFALSGLIMVRQSSNQFSEARSPWRFAYRRLVRIVPLYWLATLIWFSHFLQYGKTLVHAQKQLLLSLLFIPNFVQSHGRMEPVLEPGWTLNYEMGFYFLFALALLLPRRVGVLVLFATLQLLVAAGRDHTLSNHPMLAFYTNSILLCLSYGVLIGFVEAELKSPPRIAWPISPAYLLFIPACLMLAWPRIASHINPWEMLSLFSAGVVFACTLTPAGRRRSKLSRLMVLLGDASFATYLGHLFVYPIVFVVLVRSSVFLRVNLLTPLFFALCAVLVANGFGLGVHLLVERPLAGLLRRLRSGSADPQRTPIAVNR